MASKNFSRKIIKKPKKSYFICFVLNPVTFNGQDFEKKRGLDLVTSRPSGYKLSLEKIPF